MVDYITSYDSKVEISNLDLMPVLNERTLDKESSASYKLVVQLAYILSLFTLNDELEKIDNDNLEIKHLNVMFFDSPRDKELDADKFSRFLKLLSSRRSGQVFITGSISDQDSYKANFSESDFLRFLTDTDKLLQF